MYCEIFHRQLIQGARYCHHCGCNVITARTDKQGMVNVDFGKIRALVADAFEVNCGDIYPSSRFDDLLDDEQKKCDLVAGFCMFCLIDGIEKEFDVNIPDRVWCYLMETVLDIFDRLFFFLNCRNRTAFNAEYGTQRHAILEKYEKKSDDENTGADA